MIEKVVDCILMFYLIITIIALVTIIVLVAIDKIDDFIN